MASKVLVKLPVNFGSQVSKCTTADIISASVSARAPTTIENVSASPSSSPSDLIVNESCDPILQVTQLEQNIKFLKEQHHLLLTSLHQEVETLRQRNRDLQFQLVFSKGSLALLKSSPSSPEDDSKPQVALSPKQVNVSSLQVEILEKDITELRSALNEATARNTCLQNIVDEQKKQLESITNASTSNDIPPSGSNSDPDLIFKLEEAEKVIRRLRRENDEQRRELAMIKANQSREQVCGSSLPHQRPPNHRSQQQYHDQQREYLDQHREPREHRDQRTDSLYDQPEHQQDPPREGSRFPHSTTRNFGTITVGHREADGTIRGTQAGVPVDLAC